jgi:hypothetical protein
MVTKDDQLKDKFEVLIVSFHEHKITLDELYQALLDLNPYEDDSLYYEYYRDWIEFNIESTRLGSSTPLSLTSSGGILESFND